MNGGQINMKTKNFNIKGFRLIAQSSQYDLIKYTGNVFKVVYGEENCVLEEEFVFAKGANEILLVAHLDTVHSEAPKMIFLDANLGVLYSPEGIGGDDRCGVFSILYIMNHCRKNNIPLPSILFVTDEETGCKGAKKAMVNKEIIERIKELRFVIEIDRKGKDDMVFYGCNNLAFEKYIGSFGFKHDTGSCSDISSLCPEWNIAGVNLSHGVYKCHTKDEMIYIDEMFDTINKIIRILKDEKTEKYVYKEIKYLPKYENKFNKKFNRREKHSWQTQARLGIVKDYPESSIQFDYIPSVYLRNPKWGEYILSCDKTTAMALIDADIKESNNRKSYA